MTFEIKVPWDTGDNNIWWNETLAMVMEQFGLPGQKYVCHPRSDHMYLNFNLEEDALLCKILLSDRL